MVLSDGSGGGLKLTQIIRLIPSIRLRKFVSPDLSIAKVVQLENEEASLVKGNNKGKDAHKLVLPCSFVGTSYDGLFRPGPEHVPQVRPHRAPQFLGPWTRSYELVI